MDRWIGWLDAGDGGGMEGWVDEWIRNGIDGKVRGGRRMRRWVGSEIVREVELHTQREGLRKWDKQCWVVEPGARRLLKWLDKVMATFEGSLIGSSGLSCLVIKGWEKETQDEGAFSGVYESWHKMQIEDLAPCSLILTLQSINMKVLGVQVLSDRFRLRKGLKVEQIWNTQEAKTNLAETRILRSGWQRAINCHSIELGCRVTRAWMWVASVLCVGSVSVFCVFPLSILFVSWSRWDLLAIPTPCCWSSWLPLLTSSI